MSYIQLIDHENYEIETDFPHRIRRIGSIKFIKVNYSNAYPRVTLDQYPYALHRIIALQFIPNDDEAGKPFVDHINRDTNDYRIGNLRWVSRSENNRNITGHLGVVYETLAYDDINDDQLIAITAYNTHTLRHIKYDVVENRLLFDTGVEYRVMSVGYAKSGSALVCAKSTMNKQLAIHYNRIKELYKEEIAKALSKVL